MRVNLEQLSPDWFSWRQGKISSSMIGAIMNVSPWKTRNALWKEILGITPPSAQNHHMERGLRMEGTVREMVEQRLNCRFPAACFERDDNPMYIASLDGISQDGETIIEIKCPAKADICVPKHYIPQMQWQMYCSGAKKCYFCSYTDDQLGIFDVLRDDEIIEQMGKEAQLFLQQVRNLEEPEAGDADCQEINDEESIRDQIEYDQLDAEIKLKQERLEIVRSRLTSKAKDGNVRIGNLIISKVRRPGAIDYGKIEALKNIDLEIYRKAPIESYRITRKK